MTGTTILGEHDTRSVTKLELSGFRGEGTSEELLGEVVLSLKFVLLVEVRLGRFFVAGAE